MICKDLFEILFEKAKGFKYSSMNYIDFDECENAEVFCNCDDLILIRGRDKTPNMVYFAVNDFEVLIKKIAEMPGGLRLHFVPREFAAQLNKIGFAEWAEFMDLWNTDLAKTASLFEARLETEYLSQGQDECDKAAEVTKKCELQSRGFESMSAKHILEHLDDGKIIVCRKDSEIAGLCSVSIYNNGQPFGFG